MTNDSQPIDETNGTAPIHVADESEFDRLVESNDHVLADFYADWCGPCQMMEPTIENLAKNTDATVVKVDVDEGTSVASRFDVASIPTVLTFDNGTLTSRLIGVQDEDTLRAALE